MLQIKTIIEFNEIKNKMLFDKLKNYIINKLQITKIKIKNNY